MKVRHGTSEVSRMKELEAVIPPGHEIVMVLRGRDGVRVFTSARPHEGSWEHEGLIPHRSRRTSKSGPIPPSSCLAA